MTPKPLSTRKQYASGQVEITASGWVDGSSEIPWETLRDADRVDVAVVGAGLTGSSLALHLAAGGAEVALLDAGVPGSGASGRNAGHVVPIRDLDKALATLPDQGERWLDLMRNGASEVFAMAEEHEIACVAAPNGYIQAAHRRAAVGAARRKVDRWAARGYDVGYVDGTELAELTGTDAFHGAVLCSTGGSFNPYRFTQGLAVAAQRHGAAVFADSAVHRISPRGNEWRVETPEGALTAERVVVCTNGYTTDVIPALNRAWCPLVAYVLVSNPLPLEVASTILPTGRALSLFPTGLHPTMIDEYGRIVTSLLVSSVAPHSSAGPLRLLRRWLRRTFPQTSGIEILAERYWTGAMAWSVDELPRLYEIGPGVLALTCMSGEGNVPAPILGRHLAEALIAGRPTDLALPVQSPEPVRFRHRYDITLRRIGVPALVAAETLNLY